MAENNRQIQAFHASRIYSEIKGIWDRLAQIMLRHRYCVLPNNVVIDRFPQNMEPVKIALDECCEFLASIQRKPLTDNYDIHHARRRFIEARQVVKDMCTARGTGGGCYLDDIPELGEILKDMQNVWHAKVKRKHG